jgi:glycerophosphoryl diester phosphodiesterase
MAVPLNIAHRGGAGLMPENTLAAFADAIARGCAPEDGPPRPLMEFGAELDVQLSADGIAVVHHDFRLMADVARKDGVWLDRAGPRIKDLPLADLQDFDIGRPRPGSEYARAHPALRAVDGLAIPTLEAVVALAAAAPRPFLLMVELKCDTGGDSADPVALADAAYDAVSAAEFLDRAIFVGFDWRALLAVKACDPSAACWFTTDKLSGDARAAIDTAAAAGADGWFADFRDATPDNVAHARSRGLQVGAWTVNAPEDMRRLSGLDALCTDRPDLLANIG